MRSIALFDPVVVPSEDEWIVLHPQSMNLSSSASSLHSEDDRTLGDDESYDYCDDVCAAVQPYPNVQDRLLPDILSEPLQPSCSQVPDEIFNDDESFVADVDAVDQIDTLLQDILETVEARHQNPRLGGDTDDHESFKGPTLVESDLANDLEAPQDSPDSDVRLIGREEESVATTVSSGRCSSSGNEFKFGSDSSATSKFNSIGDEYEPSASQRSRLSNKKRRKQLKLGKKATTAAAAAAAAAATMTHFQLTVPKKPNKSVSKNKKQVGIALQAIESYKKEMTLLKNNKNKNSVC